MKSTKKMRAYRLQQAQRIWTENGHLLQGYKLVDGKVVLIEQ